MWHHSHRTSLPLACSCTVLLPRGASDARNLNATTPVCETPGVRPLHRRARVAPRALPLCTVRFRRRLPRTRAEGRLLGTVLVSRLRAQAQPRCPSGSAHPRDQAAVDGVGPWSPAIPARVVPRETGGDTQSTGALV